MLCQDCPKKDSCAELCKKAEGYVGQDYRYQKEITFSSEQMLDFINHIIQHDWADCTKYWCGQKLEFPFLSDLQNKCLHLFYFEGLSYKQIAIRLSGGWPRRSLSQDAVSYQLRTAKQRILHKTPISEGVENDENY